MPIPVVLLTTVRVSMTFKQSLSALFQNDIITCIGQSSQSSMYNDMEFFGEFGQMRCQPNGNYDPIQCVQQEGSNGLCFCIDTKLVTLDTNYTSGNFKQLDSVDTLPCFDEENMFHNSKHYRPCEMEAKNIYDLKESYTE